MYLGILKVRDSMLVLSRKKNGRIFIGDDIVVTVIVIRGDKVRLGITADKSVPVNREEVWLAIQKEKGTAE